MWLSSVDITTRFCWILRGSTWSDKMQFIRLSRKKCTS